MKLSQALKILRSLLGSAEVAADMNQGPAIELLLKSMRDILLQRYPVIVNSLN